MSVFRSRVAPLIVGNLGLLACATLVLLLAYRHNLRLDLTPQRRVSATDIVEIPGTLGILAIQRGIADCFDALPPFDITSRHPSPRYHRRLQPRRSR